MALRSSGSAPPDGHRRGDRPAVARQQLLAAERPRRLSPAVRADRVDRGPPPPLLGEREPDRAGARVRARSVPAARLPALLADARRGALERARARAQRAEAAQLRRGRSCTSCGASTRPRRCSRPPGAWTRSWTGGAQPRRARGPSARCVRGSAGRAPLRGALPDLSRRALEVAARAQPARACG